MCKRPDSSGGRAGDSSPGQAAQFSHTVRFSAQRGTVMVYSFKFNCTLFTLPIRNSRTNILIAGCMSRFKTVHYLGEIMCKRPNSSVRRAAVFRKFWVRVPVRLHIFLTLFYLAPNGGRVCIQLKM
jgi:uncharacterized membrane protein